MILLLGLSQVAFGQKKDSTIHFFGNLYDADSYRPVEYAHIININNNRGTITDSLGNFQIKIRKGDTLMITSIAYHQKYYQYTGEWKAAVFESIPLDGRIYEIGKVEITPWGTYNEFKNKFLNLDLEDPKEQIHPLFWKGISRKPEEIDPIEPGLFSPVSMIYDIFSKEGKERQKYQRIMEREARQMRIESKFNREQVSELTGLEGKKLDRFMEFCNFTDQYILNTREYFILENVKRKYKQFMRVDSLNSIKTE